MPPAYDIHPEFGYFCPAPRARRELRVAVVSILAGMAIGAAIMAIHAGQAAETEAVSGNTQLKSSAPDPLAAVTGSEPPHQGRRQRQGGSCGNDQAVSDTDGASAFEQGSVTPCSGFRSAVPSHRSRPASAGPASPENAEAPGSPAALLRAQSVAAAEPAVSGTKKRPSAMHARRHSGQRE